jgi:sulfide:quinone oxidoreductase
VINIVEMPIKCPVAPLEFAFLADHYFHERGIRDDVEIVYATPLDAAFTKPRAAAELGALMERKNIKLEPNWNTAKADGTSKVLEAYDGRTLDFDILVTVPLHFGADWVERSGLGDGSGFLPTDKHTLKVEGMADTFALGDATNVPTSKAGSVAHFQGDVLIENILRHIEGLEVRPDFDGHTNCFIETGFGKAILIDFNYDTEPLPGRFPLPGVGPFSLLRETAINHWGKLGFRWVYWNLLVRGEEMGLDHRMLMAGKAS